MQQLCQPAAGRWLQGAVDPRSLTSRPEDVIPQWRADAVTHVIIL